MSAGAMTGPSPITTACSITFSSSRTFPGHDRAASATSVSGARRRPARPWPCAALHTHRYPALDSEELALEQRLRQRCAVDGHERRPAATAAVMQRARHHLLAGAARAEHEHRNVAVGKPSDRGDEAAESGARANETAWRSAFAELGPERAVLRRETLDERRALERQSDGRGDERQQPLVLVVDGARPRRAEHEDRDRPAAGDDREAKPGDEAGRIGRERRVRPEVGGAHGYPRDGGAERARGEGHERRVRCGRRGRARGEAEAAGGIVDRPEARELEAQLVAQETDEPPRDSVGLVLADQGVADDTEERELLETVDERAARLAQRPLESLLLHQCCAIASQARRRSASNDAITRSRSRGPRPRRSHAAGAIAGMRPSPPKP